jgi:hypothetical protein
MNKNTHPFCQANKKISGIFFARTMSINIFLANFLKFYECGTFFGKFSNTNFFQTVTYCPS